MNRKLLAVSVAAALSANANAFEFDTYGTDWDIRWDNTLKYNLGFRTGSPKSEVLNQPGAAGLISIDPNTSRKSGDIITNRVDILSELDVVWKDSLGFRVSAAGWYDHAYSDDMEQDKSIRPHWANPSVDVGELNDEGEDLHYRNAEILDAFAFANFDIGDTAIGVRAGRHTIYWGQSLLLTGAVHGAGTAMNQIDAIKAFSVPGSEAKELFMPTNKLSTVVQFTENLTMEAYYGLEWDPFRIPEATTFFSPADILTEDTEAIHLIAAGGVGIGMTSNDHEGEDGDYGVNFSYYFEESGLEMSAYYINYGTKILDGLIGALDFGQALGVGLFDGTPLEALKPIYGEAPSVIDPNMPENLAIGSYSWYFKDDIDLFGLSLSKEIAGISFGMDLIHRKDTHLRPDLNASLQRFADYPEELAPLLETALGPEVPLDGRGRIDVDMDDYDDWFLTGDTWHLVLNGIGLLNDNGIWEGGSYAVEFTMGYLDQINSREDLIVVKSPTSGIELEEGELSTHIGINFNPTWYQVWPGTDMTLKSSVSVGLNGFGAMSFGGDEEVGNGLLGVEFNIDQKWTVGANYSFFFGPVYNGLAGRWKDRENLVFTVKRTF